jgi:sulfur relay (sulfurtransferase) DsrF/TusC family protein
MNKINIPEQRLRRLYADKNLSTYDISKVYKCDPTVIQNRLREYNITVRYPKNKIEISKETLKKLYIKEKLSTYKIANLFRCKNNTISRKLKEQGIKARIIKKVIIPKDQLYHSYYDKKLPFSRIAKHFSCSVTTIFERMRRYKIDARNRSEANTIYPKYDFSGDLIEKAYLIGFRLGDLNVIKDSSLVRIKSNTTKIEQVNLLRKIVGKYGRFYVKRYKNSFFNVECSLNKSFAFLISKKDSISRWILRDRTFFSAFLAGYIDAEGNIGVYSKRARVRIGSYDKNLLKLVHLKLKSMDIKSTYRLETPRGTNNQNRDFWRVCINKKEDIQRLFKLIKPYIKHAKRFKDLEKANENIILRNGGLE